ncbi:hypothetical protein [Castellaniella sp.]|uniref:hypothetical protein n=1 Tax=Castellaniella sp. TaxID=1955812 RepID=UPI003C76354B
MTCLEFYPGPMLRRRRHQDEPDNPAWIDVTLSAAQFLFDPVKIKGVKLSDLFDLVRLNPDLRTVYRRDFIAEFLTETAKGPVDAPDEDPDERIEYLELYRHWEFDSHTRTYEISPRPSLHGVGVVRTKDAQYYKAGERTTWGLLGSHVRTLLNLEIKYKSEVMVTENDTCTRNYGQILAQPCLEQITLGELLAGVFWEISFHGSPDDAEAVAEEIKRRRDEVDEFIRAGNQDGAQDEEGQIKTYGMNEIFGDLHAREFAAAFESVSAPVSVTDLLSALRALDDDVNACAALFEKFGSNSFRPKPECLGMTAIDLRRFIHDAIYK